MKQVLLAFSVAALSILPTSLATAGTVNLNPISYAHCIGSTATCFGDAQFLTSGSAPVSNRGAGALVNFMVFDFSGISEPIESASLSIASGQGAYFSFDTTAPYSLRDYTGDVSLLQQRVSGDAARAIHTDLQNGTVYGSTFLPTPGFSFGVMPEVKIDFTDGLDDLTAALGGLFAIGGHTGVGDRLFDQPQPNQTIPGITGQGRQGVTLTLTTTVVPLPPAGLLLISTLLGLVIMRKQRERALNPI